MNSFSFSIAIRTLGKGGEKYKQELESICHQSIQPDKVIVYIAEGYDIPNFRIGKEVYKVVPKGMVAQRALDYNEINSQFILLLDDDVFLPENGVEILANEMLQNDADVIAADVFKPQNNNLLGIIRDFVTSLFLPHYSNKWAFKVLRNASCSYNIKPKPKAYLSQSAAGPASLWRKSTLLGIHYSDEQWLDKLGFAWGDDQLMFNKVYRNGYKLMVSYDSGIEHLDAKSASTHFNKTVERFQKRAVAQYLLWFRTCYDLKTNSRIEKCRCAISFSFKIIEGLLVHSIYALWNRNFSIVKAYINGIREGYNKANEIMGNIPNFILNK